MSCGRPIITQAQSQLRMTSESVPSSILRPMSPETDLPSYTEFNQTYAQSHQPHSESDQASPSTSRTPQAPVEFVYHLTNSKGTPWATLKVQGMKCANKSTTLPVFHEGHDIAGSVELNLSKKDTILSVSVSVGGHHVISGTLMSDCTHKSPTGERAIYHWCERERGVRIS